jgi:hippurate hydrolase
MGTRLLLWTVFLAAAEFPTAVQAQAAARATQVPQSALIPRRVAAEYPRLEALYTHLHAHPELSLREEQTAARLARELREAGFEVTERVGGHGVVGVLKNGAGPTVMVRTDLDALPLVERTGLPYASAVKSLDADGKELGVMHACGHDLHMACWVGVARILAGMKDRWQGTLLFVGQPAEEVGAGARKMIADGLFRRFPKPDYALALHVFPFAHGMVGYREGPFMAGIDSVDIVVRGRGGHGSAPHAAIDPIVLAARLILDLQTIVSREVNPIDSAVVTVGTIHGGTKRNIIPDDVTLQLTVRSLKEPVRAQLLEGIERMAKAAAQGARAPEPEVRVSREETAPPTVNDVALTRKTAALFQELLGRDHVIELPPVMASEDFAFYGREGIPTLMYFLGMYAPERVAESQRPGGKPLPYNHSDQFSPVPEPTLKTGVLTMTAAVLNLLGQKPTGAGAR